MEEKTLLFDIETSNLFSSIGTVICIGIFDPENLKEPSIYFVNKPEEEINALKWFKNNIVEKNYSVLAGWNIKKFDIPFILGRVVKFDFDFSELIKLKIIDLLEVARVTIKIHSYKMEDVCKWLKIGYNPEIKGYDIDNYYHRSLIGDESAKEKIENKCKVDLIALAELFKKLKPYLNSMATNKWSFS